MNQWHKRIIVFPVLLIAAIAAFSLRPTQAAGGVIPQAYLPLIQSSCDEFFLDGFSDPDSGWPVGPVMLNSQQLGFTQYSNGEYLIHSDLAGAGYLFRPLAPTFGHENYVLEAEARFDIPTVDGLYGLVFSAIIEGSEVTRYYLFEVEPEMQLFRLIRRENAVSTPIVDYTASAAINTGAATNRLAVTRNGDQITLVVNEMTLGTWTDNGITGPGFTGLALRTRTNVPQANGYFDNYDLHTCVPGGSVAANRTAVPSAVDSFSAFEE